MSLRKGDTIGIVSTSGPFDIERFEEGLSLIEKKGFKLFVPDEIYKNKGYLAGSDNTRIKTIENMFLNEDVKAVFCARGGYGALRIIDKLDYKIISRNPKPFVGFSDVTSLLISLNVYAGIRTFHGPVVTSLNLIDEENLSGLFDVLSLKKGDEYTLCAEKSFSVNSKSTEGRLVGGNLCILCHLVGTKYEPDFSDKLLFIEDVNEPLYKIDRMLTHLDLSGKLENLGGLLLGDFKNCGSIDSFRDLIYEKFKDKGYPVISGFGFGHGNRNELLPMNCHAFLSAEESSLRIRL